MATQVWAAARSRRPAACAWQGRRTAAALTRPPGRGAGAAAGDMRVTVDAEAVGEEEVIRISLASGRFSRGAPDAAGPDDAPAGGDAGPSGADDGAGVRGTAGRTAGLALSRLAGGAAASWA